MPKIVLLWTDAAIWLLVAALGVYAWHVSRRPNLRANWRKVFGDAPAMASSVVLVAPSDLGDTKSALQELRAPDAGAAKLENQQLKAEVDELKKELARAKSKK